MVAGDSNLSIDHNNLSSDEEVPVCKIIMHYYFMLVLFNLQIVTKTILISDSDKIHDFSDREVCMLCCTLYVK